MNTYRGVLSRGTTAAVFLFLFAALAAAQESAVTQAPQPAQPEVKIKNFGQMDERFYRGARPKKEDYKALAALGIKTVIDLQEDPRDYAKELVEGLGMRYVNIPMSDSRYPEEGQINEFMKLANDPETGKFFVHCAGGRHRTGVVGAVYRFNVDGWNYEQVYKEMKAYDFYTRWGHGAMKRYVQDYWKRLQDGTDAASNTASTPAQSDSATAEPKRR